MALKDVPSRTTGGHGSTCPPGPLLCGRGVGARWGAAFTRRALGNRHGALLRDGLRGAPRQNQEKHNRIKDEKQKKKAKEKTKMTKTKTQMKKEQKKRAKAKTKTQILTRAPMHTCVS